MFGQRAATCSMSLARHTPAVSICARGMHAATVQRAAAFLGLSGGPLDSKNEVFVTSRPLWATSPAQPTPPSSFHTLARKTQTGALQMWTATHTAPPAGLCPHQQMAVRNMSTAPNKHSSTYKGVLWNKRHSKWRTMVITLHFGYFTDEVAAARHHDVAVKYLVRQGVLGNRYLAKTNVALGNLQPFRATRAELEKVKARWTEMLEWQKTSPYRGVAIDSKIMSGKPWKATVCFSGSSNKHVGLFATDSEAAVAVDAAVRSVEMSKTECLWRINFYRETDYLTEEEVKGGENIGVQRTKRTTRPYLVKISPNRALRDMKLLREKMSVHEISLKQVYVGSFSTAIEAAQAYDVYVLGQWVKSQEPRGPLPPTNFSPTRYGYSLIDPPIAASRVKPIELSRV